MVDRVFSYCICHGPTETSCGDTSSLLMELLTKHFSAIFGKKFEEVSVARDKEFPATFISSLRSACDLYALSLLPTLASSAPASVGAKRRTTTRSSRQSVKGWDDVFAVVKPITSKGETNKVKISPYAKDLGKLLFESKMGAAKKFLEKKTAEIEEAARQIAQDDAVVTMADGVYSGPKNAEGKPHGKGKLVYDSGDIYEGDFVNGEMTGVGALQMLDGSRYEGGFKNGLLSGIGKFAYSNGDTYEGAFLEDAYHGKGIYISSTSAYEGDFERGLRHGKGSFKTINFSYVGEYEHDQMCGMGIYTFSNGDEYRGEFVDSKFHGQGVFKTKNRTVEGLFQNGRFCV